MLQSSAGQVEDKVVPNLGHVETARKVWVLPTKMEGELDMVTDMLVRVGYVDYGNSEELGASALMKVPPALVIIEYCAVCVESTWGLEDSMVERVRVAEEELGKEEILVAYDKQGMAKFYRGDDILSFEDNNCEDYTDNPTAQLHRKCENGTSHSCSYT